MSFKSTSDWVCWVFFSNPIKQKKGRGCMEKDTGEKAFRNALPVLTKAQITKQ